MQRVSLQCGMLARLLRRIARASGQTALAGACLGALSAVAVAQDAATAVPEAAPANTAEQPTPTALGTAWPEGYQAHVAGGLRQAGQRDFEGALATLREAALREPTRPEAFCALGDVQLAKDDFNEARAGFQTCARFALSAGDARLLALALIGEARVFEREGKRREERDAWKRVETAAALDSAKSLAMARIAVLDAVLALEADYEGVRTRIAERQASAEKKAP